MDRIFDRRAPVDLPGPEGDNTIAREPLWYGFATGDDRPEVPSWTWEEQPPPESHVPPAPPQVARAGARTTLPYGTVDLLERTPYPDGRVTSADEPLMRALVTACGVQRREPENPFTEHRCYASPRSLFPVQVIVNDGHRWRLLEPERHALVDLGRNRNRPPTIALTGRYTRLPPAYRWFRGSLVSIELGIVLRSLSVALDLFGLPGRLCLPSLPSTRDLLDELGLTPTWEWSLPLSVEVAGEAAEEASKARTDAPSAEPEEPAPEAALADLVRVNRQQDFLDPAAPLVAAIPPDPIGSPAVPSWSELLWQRSSGRMPRGLHGMNARRCRQPAETLNDALRWLALPPPGETLRLVYESVTVTLVLQQVDGHPDGIYRIGFGRATLDHPDSNAAARLEEQYGYPLTVDNGCAVRHACMLWFFSVRPRELVERFGPSGWSAVHYACGWATHGLCLSAAAFSMFARPVRAFKEIPTQHILGLPAEEMLVLAVVAGTPRHATGVLLDLRV